jgi:hypothetical protein
MLQFDEDRLNEAAAFVKNVKEESLKNKTVITSRATKYTANSTLGGPYVDSANEADVDNDTLSEVSGRNWTPGIRDSSAFLTSQLRGERQ